MGVKLTKVSAMAMAFAVGIAALTGCGGKTTEEKDKAASSGTEETADSGEKVVLRFVTASAYESQEKVVNAFNESQDRIEVKLENYGSAFDQKLAAAIGAKNASDIIKLWNFPAYYQSIIPLNDRIDTLDDREDIYDMLFGYSTVEDNIYGVPVGFSTRAIHYNKKLLSENNITIFQDWTWGDLKEYCKTLSDDQKTGMFLYYNPDPYSFEHFLWCNDGEWIDDEGKPVINSKENVEIIRFLHDMIYVDKAAAADDFNQDFAQAYLSGKYVFAENGKWQVEDINKGGMELGIAPMPGFNGKPGQSVVHSDFLTISKDSAHPEEAWEFIKFYSSYDSVKTLSDSEMPIRKSVAKELGLLDDEQMKPFYDMLETVDAKRPSLVKTIHWPEISAEIQDGLEAVFIQEDADVEQILDEVQAKAMEITG